MSLKLEALNDVTSKMKIVIATSSLGRGVDANGIEYVIHFGPSFDLVDYCQQIGRAGRDTSEQCHAILYSYSEGNLKISNAMKHYITSHKSKCLRVILYSSFNTDPVTPLKPIHSCCSFCALECDCGKVCEQYYFEGEDECHEDNSTVVFRVVSEEMEVLVKDLLIQYRSESLQSTVFTSLEISSGLPDVIIEEIISHLPFIDSYNHLNQHFPFINKNVKEEILTIISEVFDDIKIDEILSILLDKESSEHVLYSSDSDATTISEYESEIEL